MGVIRDMSRATETRLHVVFASSEAAPFAKTGGLGDVAGSLPHTLAAAGADVVVMVPKYDTIAAEYIDKMEHVGEFYVPLGWRNEYCGLEKLTYNGVDYLFLDNERYFHRGYPYGFFDDGERFAFFAKAVVESLQHLPAALDGFTCDVLHCNDWQTALSPVFLREFYMDSPLYARVRTVLSIHNIAFQGQFSAKMLNDVLGLAHIPAAAFQLTCGPDAINFMQGGLNYTDAITTVSPTYAAEIQTSDFGEGLDSVLRRRSPILHGILNGIDTQAFDPGTDAKIAANYTADDRSGKAACKRALQEELGLEVRDDRPLAVMVTRLTRQKGLDLVTYALDRILSNGVQVAVLGTGDADYENALRYFEGKYPGTMAARIQFDPALSQRMYAGADLLLMPSLFEPCGLSQMIAMRYGTLPVVRETGGLKDTVSPYNKFTGEGTGFTFANFNGEELGDAVFRAARLFWDDREAFDKLVDNAMASDFSWKRSAEAYLGIYRGLQPEIAAAIDAERTAEDEAAKAGEQATEAEKHTVAARTAPDRTRAASAKASVEPEKDPEPRKASARVETEREPEPAAKTRAKAAHDEAAPAVGHAAAKPAAKTATKPAAKTAASKKATAKKTTATHRTRTASPAKAAAPKAAHTSKAASTAKTAASSTVKPTASSAAKPAAPKPSAKKAPRTAMRKTAAKPAAKATTATAKAAPSAGTPSAMKPKPTASKAAGTAKSASTAARHAPAAKVEPAASKASAAAKPAAPKTVRTAKPATRRKRS